MPFSTQTCWRRWRPQSKYHTTFMYADDSSLFFTGTTPDELINEANVELIKVFEWLKANKLSVNIKKTQEEKLEIHNTK